MAEDRAALVARLRELEQTCKAQADAYEGDYRAWLERAEAVHHAIAALSTPPAPPREAQQGWEDIDGENAAYVNRVTSVVREADRSFEQVGGSSRHWVRDCFLPMLNRAGLRIQPAPDVTCQHGVAMDVHCCNCHSGFIFDADHECPSREAPWQEARKPAQLTEPGVDLALTYQAAVKRMTAADEALAAYDLSGPSAPTPVESVDLRIGDVVMFGGRLEPPRFLQLTTDYECRRWSERWSDITAVLRPVWRRPR